MCRLAVHLEYGLTVNGLSLAHAARGWNDSKPARLALDMICRRRNLGTLKVGYAPPTPQGVALGAIELVPIEVWQLIKQHLTASTARDALQAFLHPIRDFCVRDSQSPHPPTESLAECESCLFDFRNDHDMHDHILPAYGVRDSPLGGRSTLVGAHFGFFPRRTLIACWPNSDSNVSTYSWSAETTTGLVST
jgi:hypothetical protein